MKILITGISGTLARGVAYRLTRRGHKVIGIDRRPWPDVPEGMPFKDGDVDFAFGHTIDISTKDIPERTRVMVMDYVR